MKKNKGIIYIQVILLISLLSILFYFVYAYINRSTFTNYKKEDVINSEYMAESLINILISDEKFEEEFKNFYLSDENYKNLSPKIVPENLDSYKCYIKKDATKKFPDRVILFSEVNYKGIDTKASLVGSAINYFYKDKSGVMTTDKINPSELDKMKDAFSNFNANNNIICLNGDFLYKKIDRDFYICEEKINTNEETGEEIREIVPLYLIGNKDIILQESGTLEIRDNFNYATFLIINDQVIFNDFEIFGIIVLNEGASVSKLPNLKGYLVNFSDKNTYTNVEYNADILNKYKDALPFYVQLDPVALQNNIN